MVDKNQIIVELQAQSTKFTAEMKKVQKQLDQVRKKTDKAGDSTNRFRISTAGLRRSIGALRNNLLLVSFAFGGTIASVNKLIGAYGQQELAERKLQQALGFTSQALLTQASALQQQTAFGDEAILGVQALIAAFTDDEEQIAKLTETTLDLAAAKGMDLTAAADLVSKSFGSSTNALSRYGIVVEGVEGSTERLEMLTENVAELFGGQAKAQADTMTGSIEQMKNAMGDAAENMGKVLSPAVKFMSGAIKSASEGIGEFFRKLSETTLETAVRQLREMGAAAEDIALLQNLVDINTQTDALINNNKKLNRIFDEQGSSHGIIRNLSIEELHMLGAKTKHMEYQSYIQGQMIDVDRETVTQANVELLTKEKIQKVIAKIQEENSKIVQVKRDGGELDEGELTKNANKIETLTEMLVLVQQREKAEKALTGTQKDQGSIIGDQDKALEESYNKFITQQEEKNKKHLEEQDFIEMFQEDYPILAASLGLLTDSQKEYNDERQKQLDIDAKAREDFEAIIDTTEEFDAVMLKKIDDQMLHNALLEEWIELNPVLASSMGIVSQATKDQSDADKKAQKVAKTRRDGLKQMMKDIQMVAGEEKKYASIRKAAAIVETTINTYESATKSYNALSGIPVVGPGLGTAAAVAAIAAGLANVNEITKAQYGMNEVVDQPTMILAGEAGAEQVSITPLEGPNIEGVQGGGGGITVNVSGNVLTSDFVEGELADNIREAVRRGADFGMG